MKTDDLIAALSLDLAPVRPVAPRLALVAAGGAAVALAGVALWLGFRPDLPAALLDRMFLMKAAFMALLAAAGFAGAERLARPAGEPRAGLRLAGLLFAVLAACGLLQWGMTPPPERMSLLMGGSWRRCTVYIITLSLPMLAAALAVMRTLAPTRLALAGGAAGLFSGGVAATVYGLHCPEHALTFVAVWYSLGVLGPTALGAFLGPLVLRWR